MSLYHRTKQRRKKCILVNIPQQTNLPTYLKKSLKISLLSSQKKKRKNSTFCISEKKRHTIINIYCKMVLPQKTP